jgi:hypothetical protein
MSFWMVDLWGGAVCSPRLANRDRLVHERRASHHNVLKLALREYHIGYDSIKLLMEHIIAECGLTRATSHVKDGSFCYQDIFCVHQKIYDGWFDYRQNTSRPNVPYIVEKALSLFPHLKAADMEETVKFYHDLQLTGLNYLLALMPFDAIYIPFGFLGLCPPGLGTGRYAEISSAFMELLPHLLPVGSITRVSAIVDVVSMESNNGYDLLFCVIVGCTNASARALNDRQRLF